MGKQGELAYVVGGLSGQARGVRKDGKRNEQGRLGKVNIGGRGNIEDM